MEAGVRARWEGLVVLINHSAVAAAYRAVRAALSRDQDGVRAALQTLRPPTNNHAPRLAHAGLAGVSGRPDLSHRKLSSVVIYRAPSLHGCLVTGEAALSRFQPPITSGTVQYWAGGVGTFHFTILADTGGAVISRSRKLCPLQIHVPLVDTLSWAQRAALRLDGLLTCDRRAVGGEARYISSQAQTQGAVVFLRGESLFILQNQPFVQAAGAGRTALLRGRGWVGTGS